ncbi:ATP-binding protein [Desulfohalovibrio reitneri]|uniref:ATP-binding protein n=1 Tax=Desulfohalovibrio reitneri TaxID=1307759 RepID=UPI0004A75804|nr:ATP-binding protein [Desulfohalovibrio reitneri]
MAEFLLRSDALPASARRLSKAACAILGASIGDADLLHDLDLAVTEGCANVVCHAYGGRPGNLEVRLLLEEEGGFVEVEIADWGMGLDPEAPIRDPGPEAECGRGLFIMASLADEFDVRRVEGRTLVRMRKRVGEAAWKGSQ